MKIFFYWIINYLKHQHNIQVFKKNQNYNHNGLANWLYKNILKDYFAIIILFAKMQLDVKSENLIG